MTTEPSGKAGQLPSELSGRLRAGQTFHTQVSEDWEEYKTVERHRAPPAIQVEAADEIDRLRAVIKADRERRGAEPVSLAIKVQQPHEWGYRDPVEGGFVADDAPFDLAAAVLSPTQPREPISEHPELDIMSFAYEAAYVSGAIHGFDTDAFDKLRRVVDAALAKAGAPQDSGG